MRPNGLLNQIINRGLKSVSEVEFSSVEFHWDCAERALNHRKEDRTQKKSAHRPPIDPKLGRPRLSPLSPDRTHLEPVLGFAGSRKAPCLSPAPNAAFRSISEFKPSRYNSNLHSQFVQWIFRLYTIVWVLRK